LTPRSPEPKRFELGTHTVKIANKYWDQLDMWHAQERSDWETCGGKLACENCARSNHNIKVNPKEQNF
jgi:hypothetical protein